MGLNEWGIDLETLTFRAREILDLEMYEECGKLPSKSVIKRQHDRLYQYKAIVNDEIKTINIECITLKGKLFNRFINSIFGGSSTEYYLRIKR